MLDGADKDVHPKWLTLKVEPKYRVSNGVNRVFDDGVYIRFLDR